MNALVLQQVSVRRGKRLAIDTADVAFASGRLTAIIGPNGAGKSTLLEVAAGLLVPTSGTIRIGTTPLTAVPPGELARRRAYLPQRPDVGWAITVERVVALGLTPHLPAFGGLPAAWQPKIEAVMNRFDLGDLRSRPATELSGGELARVMLARATVGDPALLIVDEPTAGLDPRHVLDAGRHLRALADAGCTVIVALHDLDLAARIADDVVAIKDGRIVAQGPATTMISDDMLTDLYDTAAHVRHDMGGVAIRFSSARGTSATSTVTNPP